MPVLANENLRGRAIVTSQISQSGKFKGKLTNGFLADVYSPVSQKEQIKTMKEQRYAACYNIKCILNAIWSSKQNNKLAIRLKSKNFTNALVDRLKSWSRSTFRSCISQTLRCVAWRQKHNSYMYKLFIILGKYIFVTISLKWSVALNIIKM